MNAQSNVLTLTDTTNPGARRGPRVVTPQARAFTQLAQAWNSLSGTDKGTWETLAQQNQNPVVNGVPPRAGGYAAFIGHNASLYNAALPVITTAPPRIDPTPLPAVGLAATFGTALTLSISAPAAYAGRVLLYGAKPMLAPRAVYQNTPFRLLGSIAGLSDATDISALYSAHFRVLSPGYKIALHVVGLSAAGFRTAPLLVTAVVAAPHDARTGTPSGTPSIGGGGGLTLS